MARGLLVIDIQRDYFPGGAFPLVAPEAAAAAARTVLDAFRAAGDAVVHLRHVWDDPEATFMRPGTPGIQIHPTLPPLDSEPVLDKTEPNGFLGTSLGEQLRGVDAIVVAGMMSSMCVDATVRAGADLGFTMTVVHDACAAPNLSFGGREIDGASVHAAFMAALADGYASVVSADEVLDSV